MIHELMNPLVHEPPLLGADLPDRDDAVADGHFLNLISLEFKNLSALRQNEQILPSST